MTDTHLQETPISAQGLNDKFDHVRRGLPFLLSYSSPTALYCRKIIFQCWGKRRVGQFLPSVGHFFTNLIIHGVLGAGPEVLDSSDTEITSLVDYLAIILDFYAFSSDTITKAVANVVRGTLSRIEARSLLVCLKAGK